MAKKKPNKTNTDVDNELLQQFTKYMQICGYLKINTAAHNCTQLINHNHVKRTHSKDLIEDLFSSWLSDNHKKANTETFSVVEKYVWRSLNIVCDIQFHPNAGLLIRDDVTHQKYLNSYKSYKPVNDDTDIEPILFIEYLERLFPLPDERKLVTQWLAHCIQKPSERPSWHLMLSSEAGTGKGYLVEHIMTPLLAYQTMVLRTYSQLLGQFSSCLANTMLILLDDTKSKSKHTTTELKSILSEERQYVEIKQRQGEMMPCYSRIILASNELRPILLEEDDRRWLVTQRITHKVSQEETEDFIQRVDAYLNSGGIDEIFWYLVNYDISDFKHKRVVKTETHRKMVEMSVSEEEQLIIDWCKNRSVFNRKSLVTYLNEQDIKLNANLLKKYLLSNGYTATRGWNCDGSEGTYYHLPTIKSLQDATLIYKEEQIQQSTVVTPVPLLDTRDPNFTF
ncbi:primase-helicase family protein [Photobacterium phosphoreum]|uniref:primase-helicase family protein n=1 Tax=Photobacterium phosphoreum TaxID=659 RepID=UPI000D180566|nr:primase-helicase family protein [Photobacterium phosphoreum]PSU32158.1 hypothetical protein CTM85_20175 [Photobacterium phosphoreum]